MNAQQEPQKVLEAWLVARQPQSPTYAIGKVPLEDMVTIYSNPKFAAARGIIENMGHLGTLERDYTLVKLIISPPGPPYEASLAGLIKARRHPEYPEGLLFAHRNPNSARAHYVPSSWNGKCLVVSPQVTHPEAAERYDFQRILAYQREGPDPGISTGGLRFRVVEADDGDAILDFSEEPLDMVATMPTELIDKFVIGAARAFYRDVSRSKRQPRKPKEGCLLFYR